MNTYDPLDDTGTPLPPPSGLEVHATPVPPRTEPPAPGTLAWGAASARRSIGDAMQDVLPVMLRRARREERPIPTPWAALNEALGGGLWPGFYTLTSGTGAGKTQWALQVALTAAQNELAIHHAIAEELRRAGSSELPLAPRPVVYVALELGELDICARLLALLEAQRSAQAPRWSGFAYGRLGEEQLVTTFYKHQSSLQELPLQLEVAPPQGWQADELAELTRMHPKPRLVVLDYLQLVAHERFEDARTAMTRVAYQARALARDHGVAVVALSSTARTNYASTRATDQVAPWERDPGEFVGLGKESGDIEYAADGVFALLRQPSQSEAPDRMHLAVAKQRGGRTQWVRLLFDGSTFTDDTAPARPAPVTPSPPALSPRPVSFRHDFPDDE